MLQNLSFLPAPAGFHSEGIFYVYSLYFCRLSLRSKIRLMRSLVTSIFLYACESWTLTAELLRWIQAMKMRYYRKILRISYKDHVTNEEVGAKIQQAIGPHEDLLTTVKTQTAVVWSCLPFIRSGQNNFARHSERGKGTRQTEEEVGRQHQGVDGHGVRHVATEMQWSSSVSVDCKRCYVQANKYSIWFITSRWEIEENCW